MADQVATILRESRDEFQKLVVKNTQNRADIASHYPYNPERWRLYTGSVSEANREFHEYTASSKYNHNVDVHELTPASGETVIMETPDRYRYAVNFINVVSGAFSTNQSLQSGDEVRFGAYDGSDGYYFKHTSSHADDEADFIVERGGSTQASETDVPLADSVQTFTRFSVHYGWYNVLNSVWRELYTRNGDARNSDRARLSVDNGRGPETGNLPIRFEVTAGSSTTGLQLNAGSVSNIILGDIDGIVRTKTSTVGTSGTSVANADTWEPVAAIRRDPNLENVHTILQDLEVMNYSASDDVELLAIAASPSNTDASGWGTPEEHSDTGSAIEETTSIDEIPNASGSQTDPTSSTDPGGYQLGHASLYTGGPGGQQVDQVGGLTRRRTLTRFDECVFLARSSSTGDVTFEYTVDQEW